jgi:3-phenylpropionate/trans-cinnamate dioxygenase ferredoxin reductase subunit
VGGLALKDGSHVAADLIVIGIGVVPNSELAATAGIACRDGIVVDAFGATNAANVFAAGDVARYPDAFLGRDIRGENWMHAQDQAVAVAKNALGAREPYREIPFMWSDQFDLKIQVTGRFDTAQHVLRGDPANQRFMWLHLTDHKIHGASGINLARDMRFVQRLIESGVAVETSQLADPNFNLKKAAGG